MITRRLFVVSLLASPSLAKGETPMSLNAAASPEDLETSLRTILEGIKLDSVIATLSEAGARNAVLVDIGEIDLPAGTDMGDGLKAGDMCALITFGLRRGFLRPDLRIQVRVKYDATNIVTELLAVRRIPK